MSDPTNPGSASTIPLTTGEDERLAPVRPPKRRVVLLVYHRDGVEVVPLVPGQAVVVGREAPSDLVIPDKCLSRRHARFTRDPAEAVAVEDLGSTNGTKIAGERIERASIKPGDQVMLGTIAAAVHVLASDDAPPLGLEGHDAFLAAIDAEIARARFFGRPLALLVTHAAERDKGLLPRWCPRVRQLLRPIDRIGFYGAGVVEILLPESTLEDALALGRSIVEPREGEPPLACGVAAFPKAGSSAEVLVSAAREAAHGAPTSDPLREAESKALRTVVPDARPAAPGGEGELILRSPYMRTLADTAARVAKSAIPVLLHGETGSGKEVLARLIHGSGPRKGKPLVCVNCGAIPSQLVESTLFGHEKGAFTGALQQQKGVFEAADGGTVLLDELGELPAPAQAALLRVLENKRVTRVGSTREIEVDVRVIAATHRDLEAMSESGGFRIDLYYRLSAMVLVIPPLRARREDIVPLATRFLAQAAKASGRGPMTIDPEALGLLERYAWPGNVRELRNAIERAVVIAEVDAVTALDLPERLRARAAGPAVAPKSAAPAYTGTLKERMEAFERDTLVAALRETDGSQTETARLLDLPLRTLQHKIKAYGLKKHYAAGDDA
jgi:DNA-binding NtrC family response regulator